MVNERSNSDPTERDGELDVWDDAELTPPASRKWVVWVMVGLLAVGPLAVFLTAVHHAPALVAAVIFFAVGGAYLVRSHRQGKESTTRGGE